MVCRDSANLKYRAGWNITFEDTCYVSEMKWCPQGAGVKMMRVRQF